MGIFFVAMALSEYLLPAVSGKDRAVVKILNGSQVAFSFLFIFMGLRYCRLSRWLPISFFLLCFWMCCIEVVYARSFIYALYQCVIFFYWLSAFFFFYVRCSKRPNGLQAFLALAFLSLVFWLMALINFTAVSAKVSGLSSSFQSQNYVGYYIVALFPFVLLLKSKILKIIGFLLISYGSVYSLKRGVVLSLILMGFFSSFLYVAVLSRKKFKVTLGLLLVWAITIGAGALFVYSNPEAVSRRIETESGRYAIYWDIFEAVKNADFLLLIIGHGGGQLRQTIGHFAHNDWLMLLYDFGFIGMALMFNVYLCLVILMIKLYKARSELLLPLISSILLMFCVQLYSMGLHLKTFGFITGSIGMVAGRYFAGRRYT